jgi:hypothetical protein
VVRNITCAPVRPRQSGCVWCVPVRSLDECGC